MKDVFDMSKWHKSTGIFQSPLLKDPLRPNSLPAVTIHEKRDVLVRNLLQNSAEAGDIPLDSPAVPSTSLYFPDISMLQVEESVLQAGNTAPGADEIPTCILKVAWPLIKDKISLHHKVLARQQFGALLLRSATDLTICLTHDVEQALNQGMTASLLTLDVKGAFDSVLPSRLIRRLREQGWPTNLVLWIASFATGRSVQIRLDGEIGPSTDIACGLPQGSPVSGILFMLYIAPLFCLGNPRNRFGYADDAANLAISTSLTTNCEALSDSL
ncbi:reverse transcriptase, putative [Talaromyces stipitatus ATCC 10500]|uniref:Reverse transcriptase, putative n=1 Tax=Talaromyces stipitatus (strain ATCC 10500 / CBS 375.48 / QM 6759 / NRRL 1006) TaxID=441959 RepID=B8MJ72_TALSN|nr:reverse transcriptase, putative [Talaromyces stipitatus ATCC 10500]EED14661.1 reverse transcriptase, putative [Talaromyces stipitatus ATCC 10500]